MANSVVIYGAGGCGINCVKQISKAVGSDNFAALETYFIDTSDSNIDTKNDDTYIIDPVTDTGIKRGGSGKLRTSNSAVISENINNILLQFKPSSTLNIVIHSVSGGSGSVIGPLLVKSLLEKDMPVIVMTVGSTGSNIEANNSLKTLMTYENMSILTKKPINLFYYENGVEKNRKQVDAALNIDLLLLTVLFSGDIRELDDSDLNNFLNYHKVTEYEPRLTRLGIYQGNPVIDKCTSIISAVTVSDKEGDTDIPNMIIGYQCCGILKEGVADSLNVTKPIHLVSLTNGFTNVIKNLKTRLNDYKEVVNATNLKSIITESDDSNNGLIF